MLTFSEDAKGATRGEDRSSTQVTLVVDRDEDELLGLGARAGGRHGASVVSD